LFYRLLVDEPLYPHAVLGWRAWRVNQRGELEPLHVGGDPWSFGVVEAECRAGGVLHQEPIPAKTCRCGVHAYHSLGSVIREISEPLVRFSRWFIPVDYSKDRIVIGAVAGQGRTQVHQHGWRAERAEVIAIWDQGLSAAERRMLTKEGYRLSRSAREIKAIAESRASPVDPSQRPHSKKVALLEAVETIAQVGVFWLLAVAMMIMGITFLMPIVVVILAVLLSAGVGLGAILGTIFIVPIALLGLIALVFVARMVSLSLHWQFSKLRFRR
jgi:hypothetical protein